MATPIPHSKSEVVSGNNILSHTETDLIHRVLDVLQLHDWESDTHKLLLDVIRGILPRDAELPVQDLAQAKNRLWNAMIEHKRPDVPPTD